MNWFQVITLFPNDYKTSKQRQATPHTHIIIIMRLKSGFYYMKVYYLHTDLDVKQQISRFFMSNLYQIERVSIDTFRVHYPKNIKSLF